jgi:DNA-binding response OmpR family regulator
MPSLVYVIESDPESARRLRQMLNDGFFDVLVFPSPAGVIARAESRSPVLFLINVELSAVSGLALCLEIRRHKTLSHTPIVLMSKTESEDETIVGLELGADDFILTCSPPREFVARINAVLRRFVHGQGMYRVQSGRVEVDTERFQLCVDGRRIEATATQVRLMDYLMRNEGRVFSRDQILDAVWSDRSFVTPRTIDVHVRHIRQMIEPDPAHPRYLKTVRGAGYCFAAQDKTRVADFSANKTIAIQPVTTLTPRIESSSSVVAGLRSIS